TDTIFDEWNTRRPDVIFIAAAQAHLVGKKALLGAPALCVEVLSPTSVEMDREDKFELYEKRGAANYWIVDPAARSVEAYVLKNGKYALAAQGNGNDVVHLPPFEELAIELSEVWPEVWREK